ncbi:MAG: hypothetical protein QM697_16050 [Lachnospiraceae bacterium]
MLYPNIGTGMDKTAFEISERIRSDYLKKHSMPEDTMERIRISMQAQEIADEFILHDVILR